MVKKFAKQVLMHACVDCACGLYRQSTKKKEKL
jgi:hypothetical protein